MARIRICCVQHSSVDYESSEDYALCCYRRRRCLLQVRPQNADGCPLQHSAANAFLSGTVWNASCPVAEHHPSLLPQAYYLGYEPSLGTVSPNTAIGSMFRQTLNPKSLLQAVSETVLGVLFSLQPLECDELLATLRATLLCLLLQHGTSNLLLHWLTHGQINQANSILDKTTQRQCHMQGVLSPPQPLGSSLLLPRPWAMLLRLLLQHGTPIPLLQQLTQPSSGDEGALEAAVWDLFPRDCQKAWHAAPHRMGTVEAQVRLSCWMHNPSAPVVVAN